MLMVQGLCLMVKYYVRYVQDCRPHLIAFTSNKKRATWMLNFLLNLAQLNEDNWIELLFEGEVSWSEDAILQDGKVA